MTHLLTTQISHHGYLAIFLLMVLESACIPIPSEVIMLFGGALAGGLLAAHGHAQVNLIGIGLAGAVGNLVGSLVSYAVGRIGGRPLLERYGRMVLIQPSHIDRAEEFFGRRGDAAVLIGRLLPVVRTFISLPAGVAEMPLARFAAFTFVGCLPWTFALSGVGYAVAANWSSVAHWFSYASIVIAVLLAGAIAWWIVGRLRARAASS